ncbi:MAG: DinB family protein [Acidobacteria bacterium]|nr:DinB family protein [Acidobacteriota bacterium]
MSDQQLRKHLIELLEGKSAHIDIDGALADFPLDQINTRVDGSPHTAWQLLEHIRIAQSDILEFSRNAQHESPPWPDGYWPNESGTEESWKISAAQVLADLDSIREMAGDDSTDLFAPIPHGDGQTVLREILLVTDHNAYHLGQLMLVRRMLEGK